MSVITEVRRDREELARVLKKHRGIRMIVEELYPDSAHFIYELLQNAEDVGASEVSFTLSPEALVFEHNGRPFDVADLRAITDIGEGTKKGDDDQIGRFGIGFKAVFAFTETPRIWSPTFSFEIVDLVLPSELPQNRDLGSLTRFEFPFNHAKMSAADAYEEVKVGLYGLSVETLLFLSGIGVIRWAMSGGDEGSVSRVRHSENHLQVLRRTNGRTRRDAHYLRFAEPVKGLEKQEVAIAIALDSLPSASKFDQSKPLKKQFRVVPVVGHVAVFFPAEKEASGLRFHLHGPFVPELSRASIKDTPANRPLFKQLAALVPEALEELRKLGLLTRDVLAVLPNPHDALPKRYEPIREAIVLAMNERPLTPTHTGSHAPAKHLLQGKAALKALLTAEDCEFLVEYEGEPPRWAMGATQRNSDVDRFLAGLAIREWDVEDFVQTLKNGHYGWPHGHLKPELVVWLSQKPDEWIQKLYALFYREFESENRLYGLEYLCLARVGPHDYRGGRSCFFPTEVNEEDSALPRVAMGTYTSGKNTGQQNRARKFLEAIGVGEVGEVEEVKAILRERYKGGAEAPDDQAYKKDLRRFIALVESEPKTAPIFEDYRLFEGADQCWHFPSDIYLDSPYLETGLHLYYDAVGAAADQVALASRYEELGVSIPYYDAVGATADHVALASRYEELGVSIPKLGRFAKAVGATAQLAVEWVSCQKNPKWSWLRSVAGQRRTSPINRDCYLPGLEVLLRTQQVEASRLVWRSMCALPVYPDHLQAEYQKNWANGSREAPSQLVAQLKSVAWVPQGDGVFVVPEEAEADLLPKGFPFDAGWAWVEAVEFGGKAARKRSRRTAAKYFGKMLGLDDDGAVDDAQWFGALDEEERRRVKEEYQSRATVELPEHAPGDPRRRAERVGERALEAPGRTKEQRTRTIDLEREPVKKSTDPYLSQQYVNADGIMICQVCKCELPFKLADGSHYFEAVEFLTELKGRHYQNYLALCPNHAAMFRHANPARKGLEEPFLEMEGNELDVILAGEDETVYFTQTHILDLNAVVVADRDGGQPGE